MKTKKNVNRFLRVEQRRESRRRPKTTRTRFARPTRYSASRVFSHLHSHLDASPPRVVSQFPLARSQTTPPRRPTSSARPPAGLSSRQPLRFANAETYRTVRDTPKSPSSHSPAVRNTSTSGARSPARVRTPRTRTSTGVSRRIRTRRRHPSSRAVVDTLDTRAPRARRRTSRYHHPFSAASDTADTARRPNPAW